jgi:hypothetical protein
VEERTRTRRPPLGQHLGDAQHAELVGGAAEVAEYEVESQATALHLPGGDRRVEATREQRDGSACASEWEASGPGDPITKEEGPSFVELDACGDLGTIEIDARGAWEQRGAQGDVHVAGPKGRATALAHVAGAHREAAAAHLGGEELHAARHHLLETGGGPRLHAGQRLHAEDPGQHAARRLLTLDVDAVVATGDPTLEPPPGQRVPQVAH